MLVNSTLIHFTFFYLHIVIPYPEITFFYTGKSANKLFSSQIHCRTIILNGRHIMREIKRYWSGYSPK